MPSCPELNIPKGAVATLSLIDTTSTINKVGLDYVVQPGIKDIPYMPLFTCWSFLVESNGRKVLFDFGIRKDWHNYAPVVSNRLKSSGWEINVEKSMVEVLKDQGYKGEDFEAVVWSHWHWDHLGDMSTMPGSVKLIVGPGFKEAFMPGYPAGKTSSILESDYDPGSGLNINIVMELSRGRELMELDFTGPDALKIGRMNALDYFGDGSFYLLDTPGHAIGHLCGLVRTTKSPDGDTFALLGGDAVHHGGEIRPSPYLPIPESVNIPYQMKVAICPGDLLEELQISRGRKIDEPFFVVTMGHDIPEALQTVEKLQEADCNKNIFLMYAHDASLKGIVDEFPKNVQTWKTNGWGEKTKWLFLDHFLPALKLNH